MALSLEYNLSGKRLLRASTYQHVTNCGNSKLISAESNENFVGKSVQEFLPSNTILSKSEIHLKVNSSVKSSIILSLAKFVN